jgi:tRNA nucleotidyltransferase/poly(A) polymerase
MNPLLKTLLETLQRMEPSDFPTDAWLVGGTVRDMLILTEYSSHIERPMLDVDIALTDDGGANTRVNGGATPGVNRGATPGVDVFAIARGFADRIGGAFFVMSERFPTARVIKTVEAQSVTFDFSALRGKSIEEDLRARDFTINAMAIPLKSITRHGANINPSDVIDVTGGLDDLKNGILRMVSRQNLVDDPLRLLRAYRFSCELGFTIDAETAAAVGELKELIERAAPERITAELLKMLWLARSGEQISAMVQSGLFLKIFPEAARMKGVTQGRPHHLDVFDHTTAAYFHAEKLIGDDDFFLHGRLCQYLDAEPHRRALLKLALFLHDVGKPLTRTVTTDGKISFRGHEEAGARAAAEVCARLKTSGRQADYVTKMVREHSRILRLFRQAETDAGGRTPTDARGRAPGDTIAPGRGAVKFMRDVGDDIYGLILMSLADNSAKDTASDTEGGVSGGIPRVVRMTEYCCGLVALYEGDFKRRAGQPRFLNGDDLMARYKLSPSPLIGEILERIELATLEGAIKNREEALAEAENFLAQADKILKKSGVTS